MTIGKRIKQKRIELNLSQDELAKKVGYKSRSSIQKIESARDLPLNKVELMAKALDCTPAYLMGWEDIAYADVESTNDHIDVYKFDPEKFEKAMALYDKYLEASPDIKTVVETLLKPAPKEA